MSALGPKSALDKEKYSPLTGPDGYVYEGLPDNIKEGLDLLWNGDITKERKRELQQWDNGIRLAMKLGQQAVADPPKSREEREAKMGQRFVATRNTGGGWGAENRPVGHRQGAVPKFGGWADRVPGAAPAPGPKPAKKKVVDNGPVPGAEPVAPPPAEKKEKKEKKQKPGPDFTKKEYPDTTKALRNIAKKLKQVEKIQEEGAKDDAQKEKLKQLPDLKAEVEYLQGLVDAGVASQ
eukprot:TRINITY_DN22425_c0_g1_i2.p1 TRINITY_DN22425_c0_g1~~TRINITY_DN22425_c0_g1_i2.p1  ORF type:complete len:247 (+),score=83.91 TRINITY_DN22425_c0_g1_i2:34-741(+)